MAAFSFIVELKRTVHESTWPWLIPALRQLDSIWDSLQGEFGKKALLCLGDQAEAYSPAALCLLAMGYPDPITTLQAEIIDPVPEPDFSPNDQGQEQEPPPDLSEAGLWALGWLEQIRSSNSAQGILQEAVEASPVAVACLYGMVSDPLELLIDLLNIGKAKLAAQILLCNPIPPKDQAALLAQIAGRVPLEGNLSMIRSLRSLCPVLAVSMAQNVLQDKTSEAQEVDFDLCLNGSGLHRFYDQINTMLLRSEILRLAAQPKQAIPILSESIQIARRMQAHLSARLAQAAAEDNDRQSSLSAWEQASRLDPESLDYLGGLLLSLLEDHRTSDALIHLSEHPHQTGTLLHQPASLRYTRAKLALNAGEIETASRQAEHALNILTQANGSPELLASSNSHLALDLARLLMEISSPRSAIRAANVALEVNPNDVEAISWLAKAQLASGQFQVAIESAHLAVGLAPDRIDLRRDLACILETAGEWLQAYDERSILMDRLMHPEESDWYDLAACALPAGKPERTIQICEQLMTVDENDGFANAMLGEALAYQGKVAEALDHLNQATHIIPDHPSPWLALARVFQSRGEQAKALETLRAASQSAPDQPEILLALGEACLRDNSPSQALGSLRRANSLVNENKLAGQSSALANRIALRLGQTLYQLGHLQEARQSLEPAYRASPYHPEIAHSYARVLLAMDNPAPALAPLQAVLNSEPVSPDAYLDFARCVLSLDGSVQPEQFQMALHYLGKAMEIAPDLPEVRAYLAEVLAASGDLLPAVSAYRKALETRLSNDPAWKMRLWLGLGKVALDLGQIETAVAALQEASQAAPFSPDVYRFLSEAYDAAGLIENSYEAAQTALNLAADDVEMLIWFAKKAVELEMRSGIHLAEAHTQAIRALDQAVKIVPDQGSLLVRLGQIQLQIGERNAAQQTFRRLVGQPDGEIPGFAVDASPIDLHQAAIGLTGLGDLSGALICLERALQIQKSTDARLVIPDETTLPFQVTLLIDLVNTYRQVGQRLSALQALEQVIQLDPTGTDSYVKKAELLLQLEQGEKEEDIRTSGRADLALVALETALGIQPDDPDLLIRSAIAYRTLGNLSSAYHQAQKAVQSYSASTQVEMLPQFSPLAASILAADLARALLRCEQAAVLLDSCPYDSSSANILDQLEYHYLRAELALDTSDMGLAAHQIALAVESAPDHPSLLALQARLSVRKGELPISGFASNPSCPAIDILELAVSAIRDFDSEVGDERPVWGIVDASTAARRRLAQAALDMRMWDTAVHFAEEVAKNQPVEPHAQLCLARTLVMRAESQRTCQALEVISHAPGVDSLSEEAFRSFVFAIQNAEDAILDQEQGSPVECIDPGGHPINSPYCMHKRWQARGMAAFAPNAQAAEVLATLPRNPEDAMAEIACLSQIGDLPAAGKAASAFSRSPFVLAQLALALSGGKPRQALAACHAAVEGLSHPDDSPRPELVPGEIILRKNDTPLVYALLARLTHQYGNPVEGTTIALQMIQKALKYWPDEPRWHKLAAEIYLAQSPQTGPSAIESAISHLEQAIRFSPHDASPYKLLGEIYTARSESERAINLLKTASELAPEETEVWSLLAHAYQAAGKIDEAAACAEKAVNLTPDRIEPLLLRGDIALEEGNPKGAQSRAQAALRLEPENPNATLLMVRSLRDLNQLEDAIELLEKTLASPAANLPLNIEHLQLVRLARGPKAALNASRELADRYPDDPQVLSELVKTLAEDGQIDQAIQAAQRALRCNSSTELLSNRDLALLHYQLGTLLNQAGQLDQAIHHLVEAIHANPGYIEPYLELGRVHQGRRQHSQALSAFSQAIAAAPKDARPYYHAGLALKENKDYIEAEKMLRRACELDPENVSVHRLLGAVVTLNMVHNRRDTAVAR